MGIFKEKYTKEYFTGKDEWGNELSFGAEKQLNDNGEYILRDNDVKIVEKVDFCDKRVLEFGVGRGECAKYVLLHNPSEYVGVDFSEAALDIAKELTKQYKDKASFYLEDAYDFVTNQEGKYNDIFLHPFDIVIMFDFVEHVPRDEMGKILLSLHKFIGEKAILLINTPVFRFDNDVIEEGIDERNYEKSIDTSDFNRETAGMHCNKYTVVSLQEFMRSFGFTNISEAHFWKRKSEKDSVSMAFKEKWRQCCIDGYPLSLEYDSDIVEYAYEKERVLKCVDFRCGNLKGLHIVTTDDYQKIAYSDGNYDLEMLSDFSKYHSEVNVVFDVGGFAGINSMLFAKYSKDGCKIYTFEPNPWNLNRMQTNVSMNDIICKKIKFINVALGEKTEKQKMLLSNSIDNGYSSTSRISSASPKILDKDLPDGFFEKEVQVITLDDFFREHNIIPDVIKVDIEGAEHLFLIGAQEVISRFHPVIYMELHSEFCAVKCMQFFNSFDYEIFIMHIEEDGRILIKAMPKKENLNTSNELFGKKYSEFVLHTQNAVELVLRTSQEILRNIRKENNNLSEENLALVKKVDELTTEIHDLQMEKSEIKDRLETIYKSKGWGALSTYYKLRDKLLA